jgi:hypothetical protein
MDTPLHPSPPPRHTLKHHTCCHGNGMERTLAVQATSSPPRLLSIRPLPLSVWQAPCAVAALVALTSILLSDAFTAGGAGPKGWLQWEKAAAKHPNADTRGRGGRGASSASSAVSGAASGAGLDDAHWVLCVHTASKREGATCVGKDT